MKLAVVIPTRGLVHSRTLEAVMREASTVDLEWTIFWAHSRPIPECYNEPIKAALDQDCDFVWIVEEDMQLPEGILAELLKALFQGHHFAAADYPVKADGTLCVARDEAGLVRHTGTGCLLGWGAAFETAGPFTTDYQFEIKNGQWVKQEVGRFDKARQYGGHDVEFGMRQYESGNPIHVVGTRCGQYRVARTAEPNRNKDGWHDIEVWE